MNNNTFFIESLGCAKNQVDAEVIIGQYNLIDWELAEEPSKASLIIVNTCGFINSAKEESIDTIVSLKKQYPKTKIIVAGCLSQRYSSDLIKSLPEIDGFIGNHNLNDIPSKIANLLDSKDKLSDSTFSLQKIEKDTKFSSKNSLSYACNEGNFLLRKKRLNPKGYAYVKISEGCNHNCAYCAIPIIRGSVISREAKNIVNEIKLLVQSGVKEIELVAQDLFSYQIEKKREVNKIPFIELLKEIFKLKEDFFIRLLYMHPDYFHFDLLKLVNSEKRLLPYFDIPFQHADTKILRSMGRKGTAKSYLKMIKIIRKEVPKSVIRSTFLLGYPGENKKSLNIVKDFIKKAELDWVGFFIYSREDDTKAAKLTNTLKNKKTVKLATKFKPELEKIQQDISELKICQYVGKEMDILIEEAVEKENLYLGHSWLQAPEVDGLIVINGENLHPGELIRGKIISSHGIDLEAEIVHKQK